ncbi:hypothetical protein HaLaN_10815, partial [Haematococcus lacustris]
NHVAETRRRFDYRGSVSDHFQPFFESWGHLSCGEPHVAPCSSCDLLPNTCRRPSCWVSCQAAANPAPGPVWASSELKLHSQLHFSIRCMPTFPHPLKGRSVLLEGIVVTAPCVIGRWQAWTALCVAPNVEGGQQFANAAAWVDQIGVIWIVMLLGITIVVVDLNKGFMQHYTLSSVLELLMGEDAAATAA